MLRGLKMSNWTALNDSHRVLETFADPYVGLVSQEYEKLNDLDDVRGFSFGSQATDSLHLLGARGNAYNGGGARSRLAARLASIGETVERYSAAYLPTISDDLFRDSQASVVGKGRKVWTPETLGLFAPEQYDSPGFKYKRLPQDTDIVWRRGVNLSTGTEVLVPAQFLYFVPDWTGEPVLGYATSNGLACGIQDVEACLSGLFEAVERDAFMLAWYNRLSMPLIDIESSPVLSALVNRHVETTGLKLQLIDMSAFCGLPAVVAIVRNPNTGVAPFAIGASCGATIERAAEKAMFEGLHTRAWIKSEQRAENVLFSDDWTRDINSFEDHVKLYANPEFTHHADFLDASDKRTRVEDIPRFDDSDPEILWECLVSHLTNRGLEVGVFDMTSPDVREGGASVMRVLIKGLMQLDAPYGGRMYGGERVLKHAHDLGISTKVLARDELNSIPHPFP